MRFYLFVGVVLSGYTAGEDVAITVDDAGTFEVTVTVAAVSLSVDLNIAVCICICVGVYSTVVTFLLPVQTSNVFFSIVLGVLLDDIRRSFLSSRVMDLFYNRLFIH